MFFEVKGAPNICWYTLHIVAYKRLAKIHKNTAKVTSCLNECYIRTVQSPQVHSIVLYYLWIVICVLFAGLGIVILRMGSLPLNKDIHADKTEL